ncbi:hypothetical protein MtrunA17_Chr3g0084181 [Medicago truncatula]|uniref:Uncharacterized protein n=1 Tax=Medicago truncatula TaxID=3880 RepID=A0A396IJI0_MEDTR|nr:hypothetical protein MtrunA17_Chr3g0084181 [Medicago truncatula]
MEKRSVRESHCGEDGGSEISGRMVRVERSKDVTNPIWNLESGNNKDIYVITIYYALRNIIFTSTIYI